MNKRSLNLIFLLIIVSCSILKKGKKADCVNFDPFEICSKDINHFKNNDLDSTTEILTLSGLTVECDISRNSFSGPETLDEYVSKIFRSYHYLNFFDKIHIDKKVQKLFRDSVSIDTITSMPENFEKECKNCNYLLLLKFRSNIYPYEIFIAKDLVNTLHSNSSEIVKQHGINFKFYNEEGTKGAYISEINAKRTDKKLSIKLIKGDFSFFKSIILNTTKLNTEGGDKK